LFFGSLIFIPGSAQSQSIITGLEGGETLDSMVMAISKSLYNLQFDETNKKIDELKEIIPEHPVVDLLYAINITWQTIPEPLPEEFSEIESHLDKSLEKSKKWLKSDPKNPEPVFFLLMSHGLLAQYYNEQGSPLKTMSEARKAYNGIIDSFSLKDDYNEFLFFCGLYNYYRERYPQMYPVYKPIIWLFKKGDITAGLEQLDSASKVTVLSRVESAHYLAYIYLRYEQKPDKAISILVPLVFEFPGNLYFKSLLLESYMTIGKLDQVSDMIEHLTSADMKYFKLCGNTFKGILFEKYQDDDISAKNYYDNAVQISNTYKTKNINALGMAYAGLARISARRNDIDQAKQYYKLSAKYARTEPVKQEAKDYLKKH
jgi:tetratricopeptide (TPR) repeat protein